MKRPPFRLYPEERHWWSFADYGAVLAVMERLQPKRVLEFGPGNSTLALIEGGAERIDCCEDDPTWFNVYKGRLEDAYPAIVRFVFYTWTDPVAIPQLAEERYDLALIDGPLGTLNRPAVIAYCLARCAAVLVPTEELAYGGSALKPHIEQLAVEFGFDVEWMETGPLSGGFALLTMRPVENRPAGGFEPQHGALQDAPLSVPDAPDRTTTIPASLPADGGSVSENRVGSRRERRRRRRGGDA